MDEDKKATIILGVCSLGAAITTGFASHLGCGEAMVAGLATACLSLGMALQRGIQYKSSQEVLASRDETSLLRASSRGDQCNELLRMGKAPAKGNYATLLAAYNAGEIEVAPVGLIAQQYLTSQEILDSVEVSA